MLLTKKQRERRAMEAKKERLRRERDKAAHTAWAFYYAGAWNLGKVYHDRANNYSDVLMDMARSTIKPSLLEKEKTA